ncbi:MAG: glycoside hydrolase family 2 protein, partial [Clostridiales bacterium]|nr:glycoside hydrolase family 2 protein [Clostridiales bacterium]
VSEVGSQDFVELAIGIRSVEFENDIGFIVNGKPEKLKGVCLHQDGGGVGVAVTKPLLRQRLEVFKSMGCNAIRTSHATPSVDFMDLCDELGFYVISEFTDKWSTGAYGHFFDERWESDLTFMVKRDRNRPSVVIWSVGNEVEAQGSEDMLKKLEALVGVARALDNRPVTCGLSPHYANFDASVAKGLDEVLGSIDRIAQKVDILGLNYQEPWLQLIRSRNPDKLAVATEAFIFFKGSTYNYFNYTTENPWLDVERNDFFIGSFLWAGADYLGESMGWPSKGWSSGIISRDSRRKPISWLFESYWSEKPSVHISVVDYTMPDDITREPWACPPMSDTLSFPKFRRMPLPYMIFTNCQKARLFAGNKEYEIKSPKEFEGRVITGYLPMDHEVVTVKGYNGGTEVASHSIYREGTATRLVLDQEYSDVLPGGQLQVNVLAVDENGHVNHRAEGEVFFEAEGGFLLESAFNGDMLSEYPLNSKSAKLFKGAASAIVRRKSGNARLLAKCEGLEPAVLYF